MEMIRILLTAVLLFITVANVLNDEGQPILVALWSAAIYVSTMHLLTGD